MLLKEETIVHVVKLVTTEDQIILVGSLQKITKVLPYSVGCSLIPARGFRRLLCRQNFDKVFGKIVEFVTSINMAMQRSAVELCQDIDPAQPRIQAVADWYINQAIFARERYRGLCTILCKREQAGSRTTTHDDGERFILRGI